MLIATLSDLRHLMQQIGPTVPEISAIFQHDTDQWDIEFDEQVVLHLGWQSDSSALLLSCSLGQTPVLEKQQRYAAYLRTNLMWFGVVPIRIALRDPDDVVMLIGEYAGVGLSIDFLRQTFHAFLAHASRIVEEWEADDLSDTPYFDNEKVALQMIKA